MRGGRILFLSLAILAVVFVGLLSLVAPGGRCLVFWQLERNPLLEGRKVAEREGCFNCHAPDGGREIPNPGSRWGSVPRFRAGNAMMYGSNRGEIEEFIRYGALRVWLEDPVAQKRLARQRVRMPAYGERLSDGDVERLVGYVAAVEGVELAGGDRAQAGRKLAQRHGCLSCHGVEGAGGLPNPGSLGGFVPGFLGRNFQDLVRDREEFGEWIRTGTSARLARKRIVRFFWQRQAISMPSYDKQLDEAEIDALWNWVEAVRNSA